MSNLLKMYYRDLRKLENKQVYGSSKFGIHNPNGEPDDHDVYDYIHDMMNQSIIDEYRGAFIKRGTNPRTYYIINIWQNDDDSISAICTYAIFAQIVQK